MMSVENYAKKISEYHGIRGHGVLPDGTAVYAAYRGGNYELCTPDGQVTDTENDITNPSWFAEREAMLALRDSDGSERHDIVEVDPENGAVTPLLEDKFRNTSPSPNPTEPTQIAFVSNRDRSLDLYTLNLEHGDVTKRSTNAAPIAGYAWSPQGDAIVYESGLYEDTSLRIIDLADKTDEVFVDEPDSKQLLVLPGGRKYRNVDAWSSEGILFTTTHETGYQEIGLADPSGEYELLHVTHRDKFSPQWTPDGDVVYFEPNSGNNEIHRVGEDGVTPVEPEYDNRYLRITDHGISYVQERPNTAGDLKRNGETIAAEGTVDVPTVVPEQVTYESSGGQEIHARLYTPDGEATGAVVVIHGGPMSQHWNRLDPHAQSLVRAGFEVLAPDYRGSIGYGHAFQTALVGDVGGVDVEDVAAGARYLRDERGHSHVGAFGMSWGGYLTLMGVATTDAFDVGCDVSGIVNWQTIGKNARGYMREAMISVMGGSLEERPEFYEERSPITHVDDIDVPLVVVQGANDPRTPQSEAEQLVSSLDERDIPYEYVLFEDEGHVIVNPENRAEYLSRLVSLFQSATGE